MESHKRCSIFTISLKYFSIVEIKTDSCQKRKKKSGLFSILMKIRTACTCFLFVIGIINICYDCYNIMNKLLSPERKINVLIHMKHNCIKITHFHSQSSSLWIFAIHWFLYVIMFITISHVENVLFILFTNHFSHCELLSTYQSNTIL